MKYLLVIFLFFVLNAVSQNIEETIRTIPPGTRLFNQKMKVEYFGSFRKFGYITVTDTIRGETIISKNTGQLDTYSESFEPFGGQFHIYFSETTVPPLLDSLEDGTYAMLYTSFPYGDGDTVKLKTDAVYALIPVKNFMVNGTVSWYYPNGKLAQKSEYLNGEKHGQTHYIQRDTKNDKPILTEKKTYQYNTEDGTYYSEYNRNISNQKDQPNFKTFVCSAYKKRGVYDGDFSIDLEKKVFVSGRLKEGEPVDHWIINQWTTKGKKLVLLPNMEFEINDDSSIVHLDFIHRTLFSSESVKNSLYQAYSRNPMKANKNYAQNWLTYLEIQTLVEEWNSDQYYTGKNSFSTISNIRSVQNCLGLLDKANNYNKLWNPKWSNHPVLVDSLGKSYTVEDAIQSCGIYYDFKQFTSYHPNGKLHFSVDFMDTTNISQTPVFREDGSILNEIVFDKKDGLYHLKEYTLKGKTLYESVYKKSGKLVAFIDLSKIKIIDGDTLRSNQRSDWWFYRDIKDSSENRSICQTMIMDYKTGQLLESHYYNPFTKKGRRYWQELATGTSRALEYEYDSLNQVGIFRETYAFKDLSFTITGKGDWRNAHFIYDIDNGFINEYEVGKLMQNKQPFNANFHISISEKKRPTKSHFSKGTYSIILNPENNTLFNSFFAKLNRHLYTNERLNQETHNWVPDTIQQRINLKDLHFTVKNGKPADSIIKKTAAGYYLMKYYFANDSLIEFNNKDQWLSRNGTVYYGSYAEDFESNWISKITCNNDSRKTHSNLDLNSKGDTLYYFHQNNLNGISVYASLRDGKKLRSISLNDTILQYTSHNTSYSDSFVYNRNMQTCRKYDKDEILKTDFLLKQDLLYQINRYKQGILSEEQFITNGYVTLLNKYTNGLLVATTHYFPADSVIPNLDDLPEELDHQIVRYLIPEDNYGFSPRYSFTHVARKRFTRYQNGKTVEKGMLVSNRKSGIWNYTYPGLPAYQMDFHDTSFHYETTSTYKKQSYVGTYVQKNERALPWKSGTFSEFDSEYNCMDDNYSEQYIIQYDTWNGEPTKGKSIQVVNYYPNGTKMNEGTIVNGKPEGLWFWYHNDGLLYQAGKYNNGMREGRWMLGDLSKVRFTGETCLDPNSKEYSEIIQNIVVDIIYYREGLITKRESHQLNLGK